MAEETRGLRGILSSSRMYNLFQRLVGAERFRRIMVSEVLRPAAGTRILDLGCGTAEVLAYLPESVHYVGYDTSEKYIRSARTKFGSRGTFFSEQIEGMDFGALQQFDLVVAIGLLHHLDDPGAEKLMHIAWSALGPKGRLVTIDPGIVPGQNPLGRLVIACDRGKNVRSEAGYRDIAAKRFPSVECTVRHDMMAIPFTHVILTCSDAQGLGRHGV